MGSDGGGGRDVNVNGGLKKIQKNKIGGGGQVRVDVNEDLKQKKKKKMSGGRVVGGQGRCK